MKVATPTAAHQAFHADMAALMKKHLANEPAEVLLAIASQTVGQLIAMQDQRKITPGMALMIVQENIEAGNAQAIAEVMNPKGNG